jgi:hypothetical protein
MLELVVANSAEGIELHELMKSEYFYKCPRKTCNYQYKTTVGHVMTHKECPKCGR